MAYTISTVNNAATLVGSAGVDVAVAQLAPTVTSLQVSSFEDADDFVNAFAGTISGSRVGMGANADTAIITAAGFTDTEVLLGDGRDVATLEFGAGNRFSVKGGGGLDRINLNTTSTPGGELIDSFVNGNAGRDFITSTARLVSTSIVGGSEDDVLTISGVEMIGGRINGQVGEDQIVTTFAAATNATVYGGSEDDFLQDLGAGSVALSGDKGDDVLTGSGNDALFGGDDSDVLFMNGFDEATGGSGVDLFDIVDVTSSAASIYIENPAEAPDGFVSNGDIISFGAGGQVAVITDATAQDQFQITAGATQPGNAATALFGTNFTDIVGGDFVSVIGEFTETTAGTLFTVDENGSDQLLQLSAAAGVDLSGGTDFVVLLDATSPVASQVFG